jgi:hypothetical protein
MRLAIAALLLLAAAAPAAGTSWLSRAAWPQRTPRDRERLSLYLSLLGDQSPAADEMTPASGNGGHRTAGVGVAGGG